MKTRTRITTSTDATLRDSDTARVMTDAALRLTRKEYAAAIQESIDSPETEGHIYVRSRRVYASI